jgi:hypothetical protein
MKHCAPLQLLGLALLTSGGCSHTLGAGDAGARDGGMRDLGSRDAGFDAAVCEDPFAAVAQPASEPPFSGTVFIDPDMLTDGDPSSLVSLTYVGVAPRTMFDRRTDTFNSVNAHVFDARFGTTVSVEVQVNPEFTVEQAETEARFYATAVGRLPAFAFRDLRTMWIHAGHFLFGGGNENLLIHTAQGVEYASDGYLEEVLLHESAHTSLDAYHATTARWQEAQRADEVALSTYARDFPEREDVAETLGPYLAVRFWSDRLPAATVALIQQSIPNRITYFDCLGLSTEPVR